MNPLIQKTSLLLLLALLFPGQIVGLPVAGLYSHEVAVTSQSDAERNLAFREALQAVLLKVTGEQRWLENSAIQQALDNAQSYVEACRTRPDFLYENDFVAVYVDGPHHDYEDRQKRDVQLTTCMEDYGYTVLRFHHEDDWLEIIKKYPHVFGKLPVSV